MIVVDASVLLAAEDTDDAHHGASRRLLEAGRPLATLDLAFYEVTNVAARMWRNRRAGERLRQRIDLISEYGTVVRVDRRLVDDAALVAEDYGISGYDAGYVVASRNLGATLASCDVRDLVGKQLAELPADLLG